MGAGRGRARRVLAATGPLLLSVPALSERQYEGCAKLTLGPGGTMLSVLEDARERGDDSIMVVVNSSGADVRGWGMLDPPLGEGNSPQLHVFVSPLHRSKGLGRQLVGELLAHSERIYGFPPQVAKHDVSSARLYASFSDRLELLCERCFCESDSQERCDCWIGEDLPAYSVEDCRAARRRNASRKRAVEVGTLAG